MKIKVKIINNNGDIGHIINPFAACCNLMQAAMMGKHSGTGTLFSGEVIFLIEGMMIKICPFCGEKVEIEEIIDHNSND